MRTIIALAALVTTTVTATADTSFVLAGQKGKFNAIFVGCKDQENETRFRTLVSNGDKAAAVKFSDQKGGDCVRIRTGTVGTVEDLSVFHGTSCFRPEGEPDCLWVPTDFVEKL